MDTVLNLHKERNILGNAILKGCWDLERMTAHPRSGCTPDKLCVSPITYTRLMSCFAQDYMYAYNAHNQHKIFGLDLKVNCSLKGNVAHIEASNGIEGIELDLPQEYRGFGGLAVFVKSRANYFPSAPQNEQNAANTLREMISERDFRKYLKYGFILVQGASGRTYQIFRTSSHTKVRESGKVVEEICVRLRDFGMPPTDRVIAVKTLIEADEGAFRSLGNVYNMRRAA